MTKRPRRPWLGVLVMMVVAIALSGCAAKNAYRSGKSLAKKGEWDAAVAKLTVAMQKDPGNIAYKIALENARLEASRTHYAEARKQMTLQELEKAAEELEIASNYDPGNRSASDDLRIVRDRIRKREEALRNMADFEERKRRMEALRRAVPKLSPRSTAPISMRFPDQGLQKIFETLGKLAGINVLFDPDFRDRRVDVNLSGVSFEDALNQLTFVNRLFYKVLDQNTIIIVPESPQKRRTYEDVLLQTFYLQNAETKDVDASLKQFLGSQAKVTSNVTLGAISVVGTVDELALAQRIIDSNDKPRGEVLVAVEILEVNRDKAKEYGLQLSQYQAGVTFDPTGDSTNGGFTQLRAHMLSSFNLSDFVVSIPSTLFTKFVQNDSTVRILASPRLRAAEGKKTTLKIGSEVPIPVTTFQTNVSQGSQAFTPATSFQYRTVGVQLDLTPKVSASGDITLEVSAEFSLQGNSQLIQGQLLPTFLTRNVNGVLRLQDGETSVIGGLLQSRSQDSKEGIIGLQSIPLFSKLFTSNVKQSTESEVIISITPHLVRAPKITDEDLAQLPIGTREITRVPNARGPLFGMEAVPSPSPSPAGAPAVGASPLPGAAPGVVPVPAPVPAPPVVPAPQAPAPIAPGTNPDSVIGPGAPPGAFPPMASPAPPATGPNPLPPGASAVPPGPGSMIPSGTAPEPAPTPVAAGAPVPPPVPAAAVSIAPPEATLKVGETTTIAVTVLGAQDLRGVDLLLSYDSALLEAVDVAPGSLLTLDGATVGVEKGLETGRVRARFTRPTGAAGSGEVVSVTFRALRPGQSPLLVESFGMTMGASRLDAPVRPGRIGVTQ